MQSNLYEAKLTAIAVQRKHSDKCDNVFHWLIRISFHTAWECDNGFEKFTAYCLLIRRVVIVFCVEILWINWQVGE